MSRDFEQIGWDDRVRRDWRELLRLAVGEDLGEAGDLTTRAVVPERAIGRSAVVARQPGVLAGLPGVEMTLAQFDRRLRFQPHSEDGRPLQPGQPVGRIEGPAGGILMAERLLLNLLGRLSGIATLTRRYVDAVRGSGARIYDTRKTTPGWRRLEKYAVGCGGGANHRTGLFDAILIKDNHLAVGAGSSPGTGSGTPAEAVARARDFIAQHVPEPARAEMIVEIEVDTLAQLEAVLPAGPDIVLLDNFSASQLCEAVARRRAVNPAVELEASGGVSLETVAEIAASGVERISVGALTHAAVWLDFGLDWLSGG